jgi:putative phage-type endonuclease
MNPSEAMEWGNRLESLIREHYVNVTGWKVVTFEKPIVSGAYPFMRANLDGMALTDTEGRVVQVKTARSTKGWGEQYSSDIPRDYYFQVQHEMFVAELGVADLPVLFHGNKFAIYTVEADPDFQDLMIAMQRRFWKCVERREPPPPVTAEDIAALYPKSSGEMVTATSQVTAKHAELGDIRKEIDRLEERKKALESSLKLAIGEADGLKDEDGNTLATWKSSESKRFNTAAFRKEQADMFEKYRTQVAYRTFLYKQQNFGGSDES